MTKKELIEAINQIALGETKTSINTVLDVMTQVITEQLQKGEEVTLHGLGTFKVKTRPERSGRNPSTGLAITIPAAQVASFKVSKTLKDALN